MSSVLKIICPKEKSGIILPYISKPILWTIQYNDKIDIAIFTRVMVHMDFKRKKKQKSKIKKVIILKVLIIIILHCETSISNMNECRL